LEGVLKKLENAKSPIWAFVFGVLAVLILHYVSYAKKRLELKKDVAENKALLETEKAANESDAAKAKELEARAEKKLARAKELDVEIAALDSKVQDARTRIDAARSIDELSQL
tara:strand:+ start:275 stop:613 length:339 start_codon:yes stop_codon:yes gene_type:complete